MRHQGTGVLYLLKDKLQLYVNVLPTILEHQFKHESIDQLTVVNTDELNTEIMHFVADNQISPSSLIIVIADNASHMKKLVQDKSEEEQKKKFMTTTPFPHLAMKTISTTNGQFLYGVNYDLCKSIKAAFEKVGFSVDFVLPALCFGDDFTNKRSLSVEDITVVFKEAFIKDDYNLIPTAMVPDKEELDHVMQKQTNKDIMRLYAAASIFGMLVLAVVLIWNTYSQQPQTYRGRATSDLENIVMPNEQETKDLRVQMLYNSSASIAALNLNTSLEKYHFKSVNMLLQPGQTQVEIRFSNRTSPTVRGAIITEVQQYATDILVVEQPDAAFDITITLQ